MVCAATPAFTVGYTWDTEKGSDGSWFDSEHWSPSGFYPRLPDDGAMIDNDPSVVSNVTYPQQYRSFVNWIQINANQVSLTNPDGDPDRLNVYGYLEMATSETNDPPLLNNNGILYLDGALWFPETFVEADYG